MLIMDFEKLKIIEGDSWDVFLHQDQTSLGKSYFWYKNVASDFLQISKEELLEFYEMGNRLKSSLEKSFSPDKYNYMSLNNATTHLHMHIVPRYSTERELFGYLFKDDNFGKSYVPNSDFKVSEETLINITNLLKENLSF